MVPAALNAGSSTTVTYPPQPRVSTPRSIAQDSIEGDSDAVLISTSGSKGKAPVAPSHADPEAVVVYTDGACRANGTAAAVAGIGVWWGDCDPRCVRNPFEIIYTVVMGVLGISLNDAPGSRRIIVLNSLYVLLPYS